MSDLMLLGVLRMPLPKDPQEIGVVEWIQFRSRARQAADRIESDAAEIAKLQACNAALVEALRVADVEIMENIRAFEGVASDIRAAIEAARGE